MGLPSLPALLPSSERLEDSKSDPNVSSCSSSTRYNSPLHPIKYKHIYFFSSCTGRVFTSDLEHLYSPSNLPAPAVFHIRGVQWISRTFQKVAQRRKTSLLGGKHHHFHICLRCSQNEAAAGVLSDCRTRLLIGVSGTLTLALSNIPCDFEPSYFLWSHI